MPVKKLIGLTLFMAMFIRPQWIFWELWLRPIRWHPTTWRQTKRAILLLLALAVFWRAVMILVRLTSSWPIKTSKPCRSGKWSTKRKRWLRLPRVFVSCWQMVSATRIFWSYLVMRRVISFRWGRFSENLISPIISVRKKPCLAILWCSLWIRWSGSNATIIVPRICLIS